MASSNKLTSRRFAVLAPLLALLLAVPAWAAPLAELSDAREQAVLRARAGDTGPALKTLKALYAREPTPAVLHDLLAVAHWHGDVVLASELSDRLDWRRAPQYALLAAAQSRRTAKRFAAARDAYSACARRWPTEWTCQLNAALSLAETGATAPALAELNALSGRYPRPAELEAAKGYVHRLARDWAAAAAAYLAAAELDPSRKEYPRLAALNLLDLGAPARARQIALRYPDALKARELTRIDAAMAARAVRWAALPPEEGAGPFDRTDQAIALLEARLEALADSGGPALLRARFDYLLALRQRERMADVIQAYEELHAQGIELPPYVLNAAGDAYLARRQPRTAIALYQRSLALLPRQLETEVALVFALVEAERFDQAFAKVDALAAAEPSHRAGAPNGDKLRLDTLAAIVRAYAELHPQASSRLEPLLAEAPQATELRTTLASVHRWRGWPRRAEQEYRIALSHEPRSLDAEVGLTGTRLDLWRYAEVESAVDGLRGRYPDNARVAALEQTWQRERGWQVSSEAGFGESTGDAVASEEWTLRSDLYSPLLTPRLRAYAWQYTAQSEIPEGSADYRRLGAGLDYRFDGLHMYAALQTDPGRGDQSGFLLGADWAPTDHWRFAAGYDSRSVAVPLRAYHYGIDGNALDLGMAYRWSERRRLDLGLTRLDMSDGNERLSFSASLRQRLYTSPRLKLDGSLGLYGSRNSAEGAPYFNPERDASVGLSLNADWLSWRHYDRAFRQGFSAGVASYHQKGFGNAPLYDLGYRHDWRLGPRLGVYYGLSWRSRVYDGDREQHTALFLGLNGSF